MNNFTQYHLDPENYNFLDKFQQHWRVIKGEYLDFIHDKTINANLINQVMTPRSQTITTKQPGTYEGIGLLFHGKNLLQVIQDNSLSWSNYTNIEIDKSLSEAFDKHFKQTFKCIHSANAASENAIRNVYFSVFKPGLDIKCHINYNPHIYRGYLGLIVPSGDIAMKICSETLTWNEGKFMVLDHTYPHCPHNRTSESRVALIVDFFQPDKDRNKMIALENSLIDKRMKTNPYGFGVFGDEDVVSNDELKKYGFDQQDNWSQVL